MDWTIVAGAAGAVLGSELTLIGGLLGDRRRDNSHRRDAWLRQLAMALGELAEGADPERRFAGRAILESLMVDDGAPEAYRALAKKLLAGNRGPSTDADLRDEMDGPGGNRDNEVDAGGAR